MRASLFCFVLLLTACQASHPPADTRADAATASDAGATSDAATVADGAVCAGDGEPCVLTDGLPGRGNCCISRHTCFPDGCRY